MFPVNFFFHVVFSTLCDGVVRAAAQEHPDKLNRIHKTFINVCKITNANKEPEQSRLIQEKYLV